MSTKWALRLVIGAAASLAAFAPVAAQAPELAMLSSLDRGAWEFRSRSGNTVLRLCVRTGKEFIQLRHHQTGCEPFVVQDGASQVTVQYTCRGNNYGRTTIRRENGGLVQIRSQGFQDGDAFSLEGEARRTGSC